MPPYPTQHGMVPGYYGPVGLGPGAGAMAMMGHFAQPPPMWPNAPGAARPAPVRVQRDGMHPAASRAEQRQAKWDAAYARAHPHPHARPPVRKRLAAASPSSGEDEELSEEERWTVVSKTSSGRVVKRRTLPGREGDRVDHAAAATGAASALAAPMAAHRTLVALDRGGAARAAGSDPQEQATVSLEEAERRQRRMESNRVSAQRSRVRNSQMAFLATRAARGALALHTLPAVALSVDERLRVISSSAGVADGVALTDLLTPDAGTDALLAQIRGATLLVRAALWLQQLLEAVLRRRLGGFEVSALVLALARRGGVALRGDLTSSFAAEGPCAVLESGARLRLAAAANHGGMPPPDEATAAGNGAEDKAARWARARVVVRPNTASHSVADRIHWVLADGTDLRRQAFREKRIASGHAEWREREVEAASRTRKRLDASALPLSDAAAAVTAAAAATAATAAADGVKTDGVQADGVAADSGGPAPGLAPAAAAIADRSEPAPAQERNGVGVTPTNAAHVPASLAAAQHSSVGAIVRAPQGPRWWRDQVTSSAATSAELEALLSDSLLAMAFRSGEADNASLSLHVALHPC